MILSDYVTGTITLTNGSAAFTGTGTGWLAGGFQEGDTIFDVTGATEYMGVIASITTDGAGTLTKNWEGPTVTAPYRMRYQPDGSRVTAQARQLIELLGNGNLLAFSELNGAAGNLVPMFNGAGSMVLVPKTDLISGANYDVQVADIAARATYDGQTTGYAVLVSDVGDGRSAIYSKLSDVSADWSDPAYVTGPVGPEPVIEADVTQVAPGAAPGVVVTPITGGYNLDFSLPVARAAGFQYEFATATADANPGAGFWRANNADFSLATILYISKTSDVGADLSAFLLAMDDSTNPTVKGDLVFQRLSDGVTASWSVTGLTDSSSYIKLNVSGYSGPTVFTASDLAMLQFTRSGNKGADGAGVVGSVDAGDGILVDSTNPTAPIVSLDPAALIPPRGYVSGLIFANSAGDLEHDLTISPGEASSDAATPMRMTLGSAFVKQLDAVFAEGTGNGGFVSGESLPTSGTVHGWLIGKADGTIDICFNNNAVSGLAPTLPTGFTHKRKIGSFTTDASANLDLFIQTGNYFGRSTPGNSIVETNPGTAAVLRPLYKISGTSGGGLAVPLGVKVMARIAIYSEESTTPGNNGILVSDPAATDVAPSLAAFSIFASILANGVASGVMDVMTDTSGRVRVRQNRSNANMSLRGVTHGWWDMDRLPAGASVGSNSADGYTPFNYGALGNGSDPDQNAFISCQAANSYFEVPKATYAFNDVVPIQSGKTWFGKDAKYVHNGPTERIIEAINKDDWALLGKHTFQGLGTGIPGATNDGEVGAYIDSGQRWKLGTIHANLFDGTGVLVTGATSGTYHGDGGVIDHLAGYGNYRALDVPAVSGGGSQYLIVSVVQLVGNYEAARISAGNVVLASGNIVHNTRGLELVTGPNAAHGSTGPLNINHNADWNIKATDILLGHTFNGVHCYGDDAISLGKIDLSGCANIIFNGGIFDCLVENDGATYINIMANISIPGSYFSVAGTHPAKMLVSGWTLTAPY